MHTWCVLATLEFAKTSPALVDWISFYFKLKSLYVEGVSFFAYFTYSWLCLVLAYDFIASWILILHRMLFFSVPNCLF